MTDTTAAPAASQPPASRGARTALIDYATTTRTVTADGLTPFLDALESEARAQLPLNRTHLREVSKVLARELTLMDAMVWLGTRRGGRDRDEPIGHEGLADRLAAALLRRAPATAPQPLADQAALRDRIATAISRWHRDPEQPLYEQGADAVLAVLPQGGDRAAPTVWIDGHPQLEAIAAAVSERCEHHDSGLVIDDPRNIAVATLAVVLASAPTDQAAVTPPPALTEEGRLRAQVEVLQQDAERDRGLAKIGARCMREGHQGQIESGRAIVEGHRFALSVKLGLGTGAPWDAIHEQVAELRRMADEAQPAAGVRQDGAQP